MTTKLIYIGNGDALIGVPARDLTEDDYKTFEIDEKAVLESGLYKKTVDDKPKQGGKKADPKVGE